MSTLHPIDLKPDSDRRIKAGHLWIFSNELKDGFQNLESGEIVEVRAAGGGFVGMATLNPHSLIAARLLTRNREDIGEDFFRQRIRVAHELRISLFGADEHYCRLIYSESDGLPGLIVDRFHDLFVVQALTAGIERLLPLIISALQAELQVKAILLANDSAMRELEGLPLRRELVVGDYEWPLHFVQDEVRLLADSLHGQKTGYFFDQRMNRRLLQQFLPPGANALDLFSYTGSFGLYALHAGAGHVTFVDASVPALDLAKQAAVLNGGAARASFIKADIFPWLKDHAETYDVVIVDPPALAKSRTKVGAALRAYRDLNARAMARVKSGGLLATSSCSGLVASAAWREALREAARKTGKSLRVISQGAQAPDHPILVAMPETEYLKFLIAIVN